MDFLLDTHIVIWFITNDSKLTETVRKAIENVENKCLVSIATYWEIGIKFSLGRLELKSKLENIFDLITQSGLEVLPVTQTHILSASKLEFHHNDPFDRLIIGQSIAENLTLISVDKIFKRYNINLLS